MLNEISITNIWWFFIRLVRLTLYKTIFVLFFLIYAFKLRCDHPCWTLKSHHTLESYIYTLYDKQITQDQSLSVFNFKIADLISSIWIMIKNYRKTICWKKPKKSLLSYRVFPPYNEIHVFSKHCDRPEMERWHWFSF